MYKDMSKLDKIAVVRMWVTGHVFDWHAFPGHDQMMDGVLLDSGGVQRHARAVFETVWFYLNGGHYPEGRTLGDLEVTLCSRAASIFDYEHIVVKA